MLYGDKMLISEQVNDEKVYISLQYTETATIHTCMYKLIFNFKFNNHNHHPIRRLYNDEILISRTVNGEKMYILFQNT